MTSKTPYTPPTFEGSAFNCPFCKAYANQVWFDLGYYEGAGYTALARAGSKTCQCAHCGKFSIWHEWKMIFPEFSGIEPPNTDFNPDVQRDYQEAASIL